MPTNLINLLTKTGAAVFCNSKDFLSFFEVVTVHDRTTLHISRTVVSTPAWTITFRRRSEGIKPSSVFESLSRFVFPPFLLFNQDV